MNVPESGIRTRAGARLAVDPANLDFFCHVYLHDGVWDEGVLDACLRTMRPGDVYDIGANAGIVAIDGASTFGEDVTVHAFEPQPTLVSLTISIALNAYTRAQADDNMTRFGYTHRELFGLLHEFADYSFHRIDGNEWVPVNSLADAAAGDYVALPPGWRPRGDSK